MIKLNRFALTIVVSLFAISAKAGPMAYSVNSDSNEGDSLYQIDLATGVNSRSNSNLVVVMILV